VRRGQPPTAVILAGVLVAIDLPRRGFSVSGTTSNQQRTWTVAWYNAMMDVGYAVGAGAIILPATIHHRFATLQPARDDVRARRAPMPRSMTNVARNAGWAIGPLLGGSVMQYVALAAPLFSGGTLKVVYHVALFRSFRHLRLPDERRVVRAS
jgi:hypothetical protein